MLKVFRVLSFICGLPFMVLGFTVALIKESFAFGFDKPYELFEEKEDELDV
jgi:hypothetical protein